VVRQRENRAILGRNAGQEKRPPRKGEDWLRESRKGVKRIVFILGKLGNNGNEKKQKKQTKWTRGRE